MKPGLLILTITVVTVAAVPANSDEPDFSPDFELQLAPAEPLKKVPESPVYDSLWDGRDDAAAVVPASTW